MLQKYFGNLPQNCASAQSCHRALRTIPLTSCLVFALICTVNCGTLYRQVCGFPNHVQPIKLTTDGLQSRVKKHQKDDQWKQDAPDLNFESHSKVSEYLFQFFIINIILKNLFSLCHDGILCVDLMRKQINLIHCRIRL